MTTELATQTVLDETAVQRMTSSWPGLLQSQIESKEKRDLIFSQAKALSSPANPTVILGRVAALLSPYYTSDVSEGVRRIEAEDWLEELRSFPEWAVIRACRWWKSERNPKRRQKPVEGDISERCRIEMGVVDIARMAVERFDRGGKPWVPQPEGERQKCSPEAAKAILAAAGFSVKGFE